MSFSVYTLQELAVQSRSQEWAPGFPTQLHFHHALSRSLFRGSSGYLHAQSPRRPPLPMELVLCIFREAQIFHPRPIPNLSCTFPRGTSIKYIEEDVDSFVTVRVSASGSKMGRRLLFASPVVSASKLPRLAWLELETFSKDQGWCRYEGYAPVSLPWMPTHPYSDPSAGRWSWFEIGIFRCPDDTWTSYDDKDIIVPENSDSRVQPAVKPDSEEFMAWESHCNTMAGRHFEWLRGEKEFGPEHELWTCLQPGDRIGVWMCARFGGWRCEAKAARLTIREWFEPTLL